MRMNNRLTRLKVKIIEFDRDYCLENANQN